MFDFEGCRDPVAALLQPQNIDEADRIRSRRCRNGSWQALEAPLPQAHPVMQPSPVIGCDPDVIPQR